MREIAIFPSALGVRAGVDDAVERLRSAGHGVTVVDVYEGRSFDDYEQGADFGEKVGYPELMRRALDGVEGLPADGVVMGFSNGAALAEYVALNRLVDRVVMLSGALPLEAIGATEWPAGVPAQIHYSVDDPFRQQGALDALVAGIEAAGSSLDLFDYSGSGHLFTDPSLPAEFNQDNAELLWRRVLDFCS